MNIETARALVEDIDAGAYELSEALEWALDELDSQGEAVSACLPPGSRSAEVDKSIETLSLALIDWETEIEQFRTLARTLAAEVDELRAEIAGRTE